MKFKVIACRVFEPEINVLLDMTRNMTRRGAESGEHSNNAAALGATSSSRSTRGVSIPDSLDLDWLPLREHDHPDTLRQAIQERIDGAEGSGESHHDYDAIILAYGLCGNALSGIQARSIPLYIPKAHDCSQILLGSSGVHALRFGDTPSRGWTSRGYMVEEDDPFRVGDTMLGWDLAGLIAHYGEENGRYVWDAMHASDSEDDPILYYLDVPETSEPAVLKRAEEKAALRNKTLQVIPATLDLLERLLAGHGGEEILYIAPGGSIFPSYGDDVIAAVRSPAKENTEAS